MTDKFLVAAGDWSSTSVWSETRGGSPGAVVPGQSDNVYLDSTYNLAIAAESNCLSFDAETYAYTGILSGTSVLNVYGNFTLSAGMTQSWTGRLAMRAPSGTATIKSNGKSLQVLHLNGNGTFQLTDKLTLLFGYNMGAGIYGACFYAQAGTFDANSQIVDVSGGGGDIGVIDGAVTFYDLTSTATNTMDPRLCFNTDVTISHTFSPNGYSTTRRLKVTSFTYAIQRTITANGTISASNVDFQDIVGAGSASWDLSAITGNSGNAGGNSGITFTTGTTCYYVLAGSPNGNWSDSKWMTTSGGSTPARVPLPQDDAVLDSFTSSSSTVAMNVARAGKNISFGSTNKAPIISFSGQIYIYGSLNCTNLGSISSGVYSLNLDSRDDISLTTNGVTLPGIYMRLAGKTLTLQDNLSCKTLYILYGTFDANNKNVTISDIMESSKTYVRGIKMGSGTWTFTRTTAGNAWYISNTGTLTWDKGTGTIKTTGALTGNILFWGGSLAYNTLWVANTGAYEFRLAYTDETYTTFQIDAGRTVNFNAAYGGTTTITNFIANGTVGNNITIGTYGGSYHQLYTTNSNITCDYLTISNSHVTPSNTWFATHSTNNGGNTGWIFLAQASLTDALIETDTKVRNPSLQSPINSTTTTGSPTLLFFGPEATV